MPVPEINEFVGAEDPLANAMDAGAGGAQSPGKRPGKLPG